MNDWGERFVGCETKPNHSALPNWREPVADPLSTRMSSNLGFRVINPPILGERVAPRTGLAGLTFPFLGHANKLGVAGSAQSLRARHAHAPGPRAIFFFLVQRSIEPRPRAPLRGLRGDPGKRPSRWPTPAETQRRELRGEAPAVKDPARFCAALSGRASRESTRYSSQDAAGFY